MVEAYLLVDHGYENFEKRSIASIQVKKKNPSSTELFGKRISMSVFLSPLELLAAIC